MTTPKDVLEEISAGRVLDVATGTGGFVGLLLEGLKDYQDILGIDHNPRVKEAFEQNFKDQTKVRFENENALDMRYEDGSFDMVSLANSLHHFDEPEKVLSEMERVLRAGGTMLVAEMICDGQTETQMTHVLLHHWWAAVDRVNGLVHNETYARQELVKIVEGLRLEDLRTYELSDTSEDPKNPEILKELDGAIDRYIQRAEGHPDLQERGEALRKRVREVGFHGATTFMAVGRKPG